MKNWRREAALKTMPLMTENRVRTPWGNSGDALSANRSRYWRGCSS